MKKALAVLFITVLALAVFATGNSAGLGFGLGELQWSRTTDPNHENETIVCKEVLNLELMYQKEKSEKFFYECGFDWAMLYVKNNSEKNALCSLLAYVGIGQKIKVTRLLSVFAHEDIGVDTLIYDNAVSPTITAKIGCGATYYANSQIDCSIKIDGSAGYGTKAGNHYFNFRIIPSLCAFYKF